MCIVSSSPNADTAGEYLLHVRPVCVLHVRHFISRVFGIVCPLLFLVFANFAVKVMLIHVHVHCNYKYLSYLLGGC